MFVVERNWQINQGICDWLKWAGTGVVPVGKLAFILNVYLGYLHSSMAKDLHRQHSAIPLGLVLFLIILMRVVLGR